MSCVVFIEMIKTSHEYVIVAQKTPKTEISKPNIMLCDEGDGY